MKEKKPQLTDDHIDISNILRKLCKNKILILSIIILFSLSGFVNEFKKTQEFKTELTIEDISKENLLKMYGAYDFINTIETQKNFKNLFEKKILSTDNIHNFVEQSEDINDFKVFLKSNKISAKEYFRNNRLGRVISKNNLQSDKFFLIFPKELDGSNFFNNYIEFTKNILLLDLKMSVKIIFESKIKEIEHAIIIAKKINLEDPIKMNKDQLENSEYQYLYLEGVKVLESKILIFKKKIIDLENIKITINPFLEKASKRELFSYTRFNLYTGFLLGLFFSLGIVFFKYALEKKG